MGPRNRSLWGESQPEPSRLTSVARANRSWQVGMNATTVSRMARSVKVIKVFRLLKLTRVVKASRVLTRFAQDILMSRFEMTYGVIKVWQLFFTLIFVAHWQACLWALVSVYMAADNPEEATWVTSFQEDEIAAGRSGVDPASLYVSALYWSMMTLTSIGYGDFYPMNSTERLLSVFYMIISGITWTYAIGTAAGIASTLNPGRIAYENTMDKLNNFMHERRLPKEMRMSLRDFFASAHSLYQSDDSKMLFSKMSPLLQGTVALAANQHWIVAVPFLAGLGRTRDEREFIGSLARKLEVHAFVSEERIALGRMYVLRKGMVVRMWRFISVGKVWGEDFLLYPDWEMVDHAQAVALTFSEVLSLSRTSFDMLAEKFPAPNLAIRKYVKRFRLKRALLRYMVRMRAEKLGGEAKIRSFVARSAANGYEYASDDAQVAEQRLEGILRRHRDEVAALTATHGPSHADVQSSTSSLCDEGPSESQLTTAQVAEQLQQLGGVIAAQQEHISRLCQQLRNLSRHEERFTA
jgi:hypothetical protein